MTQEHDYKAALDALQNMSGRVYGLLNQIVSDKRRGGNLGFDDLGEKK